MFPLILSCGRLSRTNLVPLISTASTVRSAWLFRSKISDSNRATKRLLKLTSKLNSSSASSVQTLTGKDFPDFFLRNGGILLLVTFTQHHEKEKARRSMSRERQKKREKNGTERTEAPKIVVAKLGPTLTVSFFFFFFAFVR